MSDKISFSDRLSFEKIDGLGNLTTISFNLSPANGLVISGPNPATPNPSPPALYPPNLTVNGSVEITGDLTIMGSYTVVPITVAAGEKRILLNMPNPAYAPADGSGLIVLRDTDDGATTGNQHAGIIWNDNEEAWDLNYGIPIDVYSTNALSDTKLLSNPRIINVGNPVDLGDVVNKQTLLALQIKDLADVDLTIEDPLVPTAITYRDVLVYDGSSWVNDSLSIIDLDEISPPTASGYLHVDMTIPASPVYSFKAISSSIPVVNNLDDLTDVAISTAAAGQILQYNGTVWTNANASNASRISDTGDAVTESAFVSTSDIPAGVLVSADDIIKMQSGVGANIYLQTGFSTASATATGSVNIRPYDVNSPSASPYQKGILESDYGLSLRSANGFVFLQALRWPNGDGIAGQVLTTNGSKELMWTSVTTGLSHKITNNETPNPTFVDCQINADTVTIQAPNLGSDGVNNPVVAPSGIVLNPGNDRYLEIVGDANSVATISAAEPLSIVSGETISIDAAVDVIVQGYVLPSENTSRAAGNVLAISPVDVVNKKNLVWRRMYSVYKMSCNATGGFNSIVTHDSSIFTAHTKLGIGQYRVQHTLGHLDYTISPVVMSSSGQPLLVVVTSKQITYFDYRVFNISGALADSEIEITITSKQE